MSPNCSNRPVDDWQPAGDHRLEPGQARRSAHRWRTGDSSPPATAGTRNAGRQAARQSRRASYRVAGDLMGERCELRQVAAVRDAADQVEGDGVAIPGTEVAGQVEEQVDPLGPGGLADQPDAQRRPQLAGPGRRGISLTLIGCGSASVRATACGTSSASASLMAGSSTRKRKAGGWRAVIAAFRSNARASGIARAPAGEVVEVAVQRDLDADPPAPQPGQQGGRDNRRRGRRESGKPGRVRRAARRPDRAGAWRIPGGSRPNETICVLPNSFRVDVDRNKFDLPACSVSAGSRRNSVIWVGSAKTRIGWSG